MGFRVAFVVEEVVYRLLLTVCCNVVGHTGVCKINGVVTVVNYRYSIGLSTTNNNTHTVYFANTGNIGCVLQV